MKRAIFRVLVIGLVSTLFSVNSFSQCYSISGAEDPTYDGTYMYMGFDNMFGYPVYENSMGRVLQQDGCWWFLGDDPGDFWPPTFMNTGQCTGDPIPPSGGWDNFISGMPSLLTLQVCPDVPTISISDNNVCPGAPITLTADGLLDQGIDWYWYQDACGAVPLGNGTSIIVNPVMPTIYYCRSENPGVFEGECVMVEVSVIMNASISLSMSQNPNCPGAFDGFIEINVNDICGVPTFNWTGPNAFTSSDQNIYGLEAGTYVLEYTDDNGSFVETYDLTDPIVDPININPTIDPELCSTPRSITTATLYLMAYDDQAFCPAWGDNTDGTYQFIVNGTEVVNSAVPQFGNPCGDIYTDEIAPGDLSYFIEGSNTFTLFIAPFATTGLSRLSWSYLEIVYSDGSTEFVDIAGGGYQSYLDGNDLCSTPEAGNACGGVDIFNVNHNVNFTLGGSIFIDIIGGFPPYLIDWDIDGTGDFDDEQQISSLTAGFYNVTVFDNCGSTVSGTYEVTGVTQPEINLVGINNPSCVGYFDGAIEIELTVSCGTVIYNWTGPGGFTATTQDISGLEAGEYFLTVTDDNGTFNTSFILNDPVYDPISLDSDVANQICSTPRSVTGISLNVIARNTNGMYCGSTDGEFEFDINGLYSFTDFYPEDISGCGMAMTYDLDAASFSAILDGSNTFSFNAQPSGMNGLDEVGYVFLDITFDNGTSQTIYIAGDPIENGLDFCTGAASYFGVCWGGTLVNTVNNINLSQGGSIDVTVFGGNPPYTFEWTDGGTFTSNDEDISDLDAGLYDVIVTDDCGTTYSESIEVTGVDHPEISINELIYPICLGGFEGSIDIDLTVSCGTVSYSWVGPNGFTDNTQDISALEAGDYYLTVSDDNGDYTTFLSLFDPFVEPLSLDYDMSPQVCLTPKTITSMNLVMLAVNSNGMICAPTDGEFSFSINGSYTYNDFHPFDASGCGIIATYPLDAAAYTAIVDGSNEFVFELMLNPNAGIDYLGWSYLEIEFDDGSTQLVALTGSAIDYGMNYCEGASFFPLGVCAGLPSIPITTNISLIQSGAIEINIYDGSLPYTFNWSDGGTFSSTDEDIYGLVAGNYMLTVTDNCGDEVYETIEVTGVEHPEVNLLTLQDPLCPASFDGIIDLEVDMVCGSVIYSWVGPNGFISTNQNISGLEAGEYFLSVTDDNGTFETSYSLMDPSPDALSLTYSTSPAICDLNRSVTNVTLHMLGINAGGMYCSGADGEFELTINGTYTYNDFFPYEDNGCGVINDFMLDPGAVAAIMDGLNTFEINSQPSGMGGVEALGWVALQIDFDDSSSEIVMINGDISEVGFDWCATASTQNLGVCFGNHYASSSAEIVFTQGGGIDLIVDGGVMPMSYNWSDGGTYTSTDEDIFGIPVGTYIVTVTDYCGQTASESIEITGVSQPDVQVVELIEPMCPGNFNGSITIEPTISCGTITYEWAGPNGFTSTDQNIAGLEAGEYFLSVTDNNGMLETSYLINDPESLPVNISYTTSPAVCMTPRSVTGLSLEVMAVNTNGMDCVPTDGEFSLTINGGYTYTDYMPFDPTYCGVIQSFTLDAAAYSTILDGENNTIFNCQPSGVLGLDYLGWAVLHIDYDDGTSEDLVVAGAYEEVGMTFCAGANWYGYGACGTVVHNATVYASFTVGGSIDLTVDDAQLPCTFNWSDGGTFTSTDEDLFNIPQGTYNVTVTDACGTTSEEIIVLDGLSGPEFDLLSSEDPYCPGAFDGSIEIEILVNCGIPSYNWEGPNSFTSTDKDIYGLEAGVYNLTVTDDNGVSIETYELFDPTPLPLNVSAIVVPELCTTSRTITSATFHLMGFDEFSECPFWGTDTDGTYEFSINGNTVVSSSVSAIGNSCGDIYSTPIDPFDLAYIVHGDNEFSLNISPLPNTGLANLSWAYLEISYDDNSTEYFGIIGGGYEAYQSGVDLCNTPPSGNACGGQSFFTGTHEVELSFSGGVVLDITEGIEPYIIDWDNDGTGDFDDNQVLYPVASGTYNLTVQDACGDEVNDTYTIDPATGPYVFEPETIIELPTCPGGADGSIEIEVVGSCGENTFSWEDDANPGVEIATTEDLFDIAAGNYTLYATNDNGTETYNFVVDDPVIDPLDLSISASMIDCQVSGVRSVSSCDLRWLATDCSGGAENMALYINGIEAFNDLVDPLALCECDPGYEGSFVINDPVVLASIIEGNNEFYLDYNNTQAISYAVLTLNFDDASSQEIILLSTINGNIGDFGTDICSYNYYTYSTALVEENVTLHPGFAVTDLIVNGGVEPYEYIWDDNDNSTTNNIYISEVGNYSVTVNDYCGQTATIDVDVVIDDFDAPVVPILADITADCSVTVVAPTASDCVGDVTGTTLDPIFYDTQGTYTITWEFDDGHGNTSSTTQTVIIDDLTGPIPDLAVLDDVTAECEVSVLVEPTATDACGGAVTVTHDAILPITDQGTTIVIWTYEDQYGNESTQMQNVVIQDVTGPTPDIATLDDITAECEVTSLVEPTATDNCGGFVNVSNDATLPINTQGTTEITWIFEDQYGNLSTQTQNVVIEDITPPVADNALLDDVLAECEVTSLIAPTATDNCGGIVNVSNDAVLPIIAQGTTVVTWTYADENGNETIQTQNIVIDDITSPVPDLVVLDDITTECSVTVLTPPTATDNCGGEVLVSHDATLPITSQGTTVVIWTYDDGNGNSVTQEQNVIIEDITSPNPDVAFLPDLVDNCMISSLTDPSATDNCGGTVIVTHDADLPIYGTSTITWTYDDGNGNTSTQTQEVIINDITPPTPDLLVLDDITDECIVTDLVEPTATDDCGGTVTVTHDATLPITLQGTTLVTWTYADENGNETTQTQNVVIEDISAPIPDIAVLDDVTAECEVSVLTPPTATDNCGGEVLVSHDATLPITSQGTTVVTWTYDDGKGNTVTQEQNVVIEDLTGPTPDLAILDDVYESCEVISLIDPTATDNCGGPVSVSHDASLPITSQGTTVVTWTFEDENGNQTNQEQNIVIIDYVAPIPDIFTLPIIEEDCQVASLTEPTATDNCGGVVTVSNDISLPIYNSTTITWTFEDENGNISNQTQELVINDLTDPIPDNLTLDPVVENCVVNVLTAPTATDLCSGVIEGVPDVEFPITDLGTTVITWTFTDGNGNSVSQTQEVTILYESYTTTDEVSICEGDEFVFGLQTLSSPGEYTETFQSVNECDSVVTLTLIVNELPVVALDDFIPNVVCLEDGPVILPNGTPIGGTFSGTGVNEPYFDPSISGAGTFEITYTFSDGSCSNTATTSIVVEICSDITEAQNGDEFRLYPNPAKEYAIFEAELGHDQDVLISITDITGRVVQEYSLENVSAIHQEINLFEYLPGTYMISVMTDSGISNLKLIIQ